MKHGVSIIQVVTGVEFSIKTCELRTVIDGHNGIVTGSKFCPAQDSLLVTVSEDRTFKVGGGAEL
jgi:hypothetical protein